MLKRTLFLLCAAALVAPLAGAQTVDEVIARYLAARGGVEKLNAMQTQRLSGHISFGPGAEGPFAVEFKRPLKMHMELNIGEQKTTRILDGESGWLDSHSPQASDLRAMSPAETKNASRETEGALGGAFVDYKSRGIKIDLAGREKAGESDTWKVEVTYPDGTVDDYFIATNTYLPVKWEGQRTANGKPVVYESWFRSYRVVDGIKFADFIETGVKGQAAGPGQNMKIEEIELNVPLDDSRFAKPSPAKG